jgi:hypothetical protein
VSTGSPPKARIDALLVLPLLGFLNEKEKKENDKIKKKEESMSSSDYIHDFPRNSLVL